MITCNCHYEGDCILPLFYSNNIVFFGSIVDITCDGTRSDKYDIIITAILNAIIYLVLGVIVAVVPFMIKRKEKGNNTNGK